MTDYLTMKLCLIDFEIEKIILEKKYLDYKLAELYELREDCYTEFEHQNNTTCNKCNTKEDS